MSEHSDRYYIPAPSYWPIVGCVALLFMGFGAAFTVNAISLGYVLLPLGFGVLVFMMAGWFRTVAKESEGGKFNQQVDTSFRWGMSWFIFSEIMFFAAFFGALFYVRNLAIPWLGDLDHKLLWPDFTAHWPTAGPAGATMVTGRPGEGQFTPMAAWGIPAINTLILLSSGATVTWAHWGLKRGNRGQLNLGLVLTIALGLTFLGLQAHEYHTAYTEFGLTLKTGVYGATFFILTGFHGFHVTIGTIMLMAILGRCLSGHFKPDSHFGFEAVSWYWHFVDVVWLLLFVLVYWL